MLSHYNKGNFPIFVTNHGNWDICANFNGNCAAIPTREALIGGCLPSHYGDLNHVAITIGRGFAVAARETIGRLGQ